MAEPEEKGTPGKIPPLFAAFKPKPKPAPQPAAPKAPAAPPAQNSAPPPPPPKSQQPPQPGLEDRLAGLEKKLSEAGSAEKGVLEYLKAKIGDLEGKLRESQEKGLSFAFELKAREEARKESRREMEEFLTAVRQQQASAESEKQRSEENRKYRERIEALEARLVELANAPKQATSSEQLTAFEERLRLAQERLAAVEKATPPERLAAQVEILRQKIETDAKEEAFFRETLKAELDSRLRSLALDLEHGAGRAAELRMDALMEKERAELGRLRKDLKAVRDLLDAYSGDSLQALDLRLRELREAVRQLSSRAAVTGAEAGRTVEWLCAYMEEHGRGAAEKAAGAYDIGFIQASLDNLERALAGPIETLQAALSQEDPGKSAYALAEASRELKKGLENFRRLRQETINAIRRRQDGDYSSK